jgi:hypothetical protein
MSQTPPIDWGGYVVPRQHAASDSDQRSIASDRFVWMSLFNPLNSDRKYHPWLLAVKASYTGSLRPRGAASARAWRRAMPQNLLC